ncbi:MAG: orotate phosphoribosyltransferase [Clostridia bacterium]
MESRSIKIASKQNSRITIRIIPGHFATNHSHINYYIDMTSLKHRVGMASSAARELSNEYTNTTMIETIVCMDGCEVIGGFLADELRRNGIQSLNEGREINVITPEYNGTGQMIFRDNIQPMVWGKKVLLLLASATTGKTINRALECIRYYNGEVVGIAALFSAIQERNGIPINMLFTPDDLRLQHISANNVHSVRRIKD